MQDSIHYIEQGIALLREKQLSERCVMVLINTTIIVYSVYVKRIQIHANYVLRTPKEKTTFLSTNSIEFLRKKPNMFPKEINKSNRNKNKSRYFTQNKYLHYDQLLRDTPVTKIIFHICSINWFWVQGNHALNYKNGLFLIFLDFCWFLVLNSTQIFHFQNFGVNIIKHIDPFDICYGLLKVNVTPTRKLLLVYFSTSGQHFNVLDRGQNAINQHFIDLLFPTIRVLLNTISCLLLRQILK